jgi:hypothetical protein
LIDPDNSAAAKSERTLFVLISIAPRKFPRAFAIRRAFRAGRKPPYPRNMRMQAIAASTAAAVASLF